MAYARRRKSVAWGRVELLEPRRLLARLMGLDVSEFQGTLSQANWNSIHNAGGKSFVFMRASYGMNSQDAQFSNNAPEAIAAGLLTGFYHYAYYDVSGHTPNGEADNFWNTVASSMAADGKHLMPVLDVEEAGNPTNGQTLSQWINSWCNRVTSDAAADGLAITPIVYCDVSNADRLVSGGSTPDSVTEHRPLWLAYYTDPDTQNDQPPVTVGSATVPWQHSYNTTTQVFNYYTWNFWQYTSTGSVSGISGNVDLDVMQGDGNLIKDFVVGSAGRFAAGTRVEAGASLNVWNTGDANGTVLGTQAFGKMGTILEGPVYGNSFWRWHVDFDSGVDGWVAEYQGTNPFTLAPIDWLAIPPSQATTPNPVNNVVVNTLPTSFTWSSAANATGYNVYLDGVLQTAVTSNSWAHSAIANGTHTWEVDSLDGPLTTTGTTWTFTIDTVAPSATLGNQTPTAGASTMDFTITYSDATSGLNAGTFDSNDITVTGPNNYSANASFISAAPAGNGSPITVTYRISAPGGVWNLADNGTYNVTQNANQVKDVAGNARASGKIASFVASIPFAWQSGSTLNIEYDSSGSPIALGASGANLTATKGSTTLNFSGVASIIVTGTSGADTFNFNGPVSAPVTLNLGAGNDVLNVNSGTFTFNSDASVGSPNLTINDSGAVAFGSTQHLAALNLLGGTATLAAGHDKVLVLGSISATGNGTLDLMDNDLIATAMTPASFAGLLDSGYAAGAWTGVSVDSSLAKANGATIGYGQASTLFTSFPATIDGQSIGSSAMIARWTVPGDTNLDGVVNTLDFTSLASHFSGTSTTFSQGDYNFDGVTNALDFNALATMFGAQSSPAKIVPASALSLPTTSASLFSSQSIDASPKRDLLDADSPATVIKLSLN